MTIKKGTKYRVKNIRPDWYEMGVSKKDYNDKPVEDDGNCVFVIGGKLWIYDEKYCGENEVVELSFRPRVDVSKEHIYETFLGSDSWFDSLLYQYYGLLVEDGIKVEILTDEEYEETTKNVINLKHYNMVLDEMERDSVVDDLTLKKLFDGYNPTTMYSSNGKLNNNEINKITNVMEVQ